MALDGKLRGTYLEIGSNDPVKDSNTYLLEKTFGWTGVSVEINGHFARRFQLFRRNKLIHADARKVSFSGFFDGPIDYLSLDIDPPEQTFDALENLLAEGLTFRVITFEHDFYNFGAGPRVRDDSRDLLTASGYELLVGDVSFNGLRCEDWWIKPELVDPGRAFALSCVGPINFNEYIEGAFFDD